MPTKRPVPPLVILIIPSLQKVTMGLSDKKDMGFLEKKDTIVDTMGFFWGGGYLNEAELYCGAASHSISRVPTGTFSVPGFFFLLHPCISSPCRHVRTTGKFERLINGALTSYEWLRKVPPLLDFLSPCTHKTSLAGKVCLVGTRAIRR